MGRRSSILLLTIAVTAASYSCSPGFSQGQPFKLGVEEQHKLEEQGYPAYPEYPAPQMIQPRTAPVSKPPKQKPLRAAVQQSAPPQQRPPIQASAQASPPPGVLPQVFLGTWQVLGQRSNVEALPQYQQGIGNIFSANNQQVWSISGNPGQGYVMSSNTGAQTQIYVDKVQGNTAFIRYQHPINKTMAQEAIVMQLSPDGRNFQGMERISIVKQGEPGPRAKVTYQLMGQRQ